MWTTGGQTGESQHESADQTEPYLLLHCSDLLPVPGSSLKGHMDAIQHTIHTGDQAPIHCAPHWMSASKVKIEEKYISRRAD